MPFIDTHAHLYDELLFNNFDEILQNAASAGIEKILIPATDKASSELIISMVSNNPHLFAAVGIHPNDANKALPSDWNWIEKTVLENKDNGNPHKIVAIGESGLDRYWDDCPLEIQRDYLNRHLKLAMEADLPIILHCREADADLLTILSEFKESTGWLKGVLHSFSSDEMTLNRYLELGLYIGFGGMITYKQKKFDSVRRAAAVVPLDSVVLETDSPYLTPAPIRGKADANQPAYVVHTAAILAQLKSLTLEQIADCTTKNAVRLFDM